jgi:hypothetical protein
MSAQQPPSGNENGSSLPANSVARPQNTEQALSGVKQGLGKATEGSSEALQSLVLLIILLAKTVFNDDEDEDESMTPQERAAKWDERAGPIQDRFDEEDVDESEVEDAIEWARSQ